MRLDHDDDDDEAICDLAKTKLKITLFIHAGPFKRHDGPNKQKKE